MWDWNDGGGWWAMALWMILFWGLVVAFVVLVMRAVSREPWHRHDGDAPAEPSSARRILEERFARGEIDEEEFRRRSGALTS